MTEVRRGIRDPVAKAALELAWQMGIYGEPGQLIRRLLRPEKRALIAHLVELERDIARRTWAIKAIEAEIDTLTRMLEEKERALGTYINLREFYLALRNYAKAAELQALAEKTLQEMEDLNRRILGLGQLLDTQRAELEALKLRYSDLRTLLIRGPEL